MANVEYREYIASDAWKKLRSDALVRSARRDASARVRFPSCEYCGRYGHPYKNSRSSLDSRERQFRVECANGLEVHHLHYRTLGDETVDDLITLCWRCHKRAHDDADFKSELRQLAGWRRY